MDVMKRILLADTGVEFRGILSQALAKEPNLQVVGETADGAELVSMARELRPDGVIMEMVLTGMDGLEVLDELSKLKDRPRVLVLSSYIRGNVIDGGRRARGADFFLTKPCKISTVCQRLRQVMSPGGYGNGTG